MLGWDDRKLRWFVVDVLFLRRTAKRPSEGRCVFVGVCVWGLGAGGGKGLVRRDDCITAVLSLAPVEKQDTEVSVVGRRATARRCRKSSLMQRWIVTGYCHHRQHVTFWLPCRLVAHHFPPILYRKVHVCDWHHRSEHACSNQASKHTNFYSGRTVSPIQRVHESEICTNRGRVRGCRKSLTLCSQVFCTLGSNLGQFIP